MPLAKLKFVVSCSDSEPGFGADNLLGNKKGGRTKWKGKAGTSGNIAVLQMERECRIESVDIGNEFSALISVLVSKSCDSKQNFQTLIPSSSFMDPMESRLAKNGNRVRMFHENDMILATARQKWDIVKIVCTQPFNQTTPYGISFIAITVVGDETEGTRTFMQSAQSTSSAVPKMPLITRVKSAVSTLKAGDMFKQKESYNKIQMPLTAGMTKKEVRGDECEKKDTDQGKNKEIRDSPLETKRLKLTGNKENEESTDEAKQSSISKASSSKAAGGKKKTKKSPVKEMKPDSDVVKPLNEVLRGVRFSLSGYQNPQRSILRDKAKEMGAVYENDWSSRCTHLVCAFRNTPKYRQVGKSGFIVTDKWIDMCYTKRKRVPEKHFSL